MRLLLIISILVLFSSCVTEKKRQMILKDCPVSSTETKKDSTWKKETIKKDTVYVSIPGPIRYFASPCAALCDSIGNLKPFKSESRKNGLKQTLETVGNVLVQKCDADSLEQVNEQKTIEINRLIEINKKNVVRANCEKKHTTEFDTFLIVSAKIFYLIILLFILYKVIRIWLKGKIPFIK